ncbi:MAG: 5-(carboxyamino)imidazole ribonucleotide mutase [Saprospiraceae bacterium]
MESNTTPRVSIIMGSDSDLPVMQQAADVLREFDIPFELTIVSAHRTPQRMFDFAQNAHSRGIQVIIAGAGGAAHLPGMVASLTPLPVIGVPVKSSNSIDGWDSILSILQMPNGIPVATVALNAAKNAGLLAARILGSQQPEILEKMRNYQQELEQAVLKKAEKLEKED